MLFLAPVGVALVLVTLFARDVAVLASDLRDPLAMWGDRSPGRRDAGALYNIKPERILAATRKLDPSKVLPSERVLSVTRERPLPEGLLPEDIFLDDPIAFDPGLLPIAATSPGARSAPFLPPMSFTSIGGGGGGGGPQSETLPTDPTDVPTDVPTGIPTTTPTDDPRGEPPPPPPAVPEPSTWLMNILGLFLVGGAMRHRNRKTAGSALAIGA